jgi:hypothetical protein
MQDHERWVETWGTQNITYSITKKWDGKNKEFKDVA